MRPGAESAGAIPVRATAAAAKEHETVTPPARTLVSLESGEELRDDEASFSGPSDVGDPAAMRGSTVKRLLLLAAVVAVAGYSSATAGAGATRPVTATLEGAATFVVGWCCGDIVALDGHGVVHGIGAVDFSGTFLHEVDPYSSPPELGQQLRLTLTTTNGDALVLSAAVYWAQSAPRPPLTWSVVSGTGRLATFAGTGSSTVEIDGTAVTITLSGGVGS
jgi:hypothetical protein